MCVCVCVCVCVYIYILKSTKKERRKEREKVIKTTPFVILYLSTLRRDIPLNSAGNEGYKKKQK